MVMKIIIIALGILGSVTFVLAALWFIAFLKICQAFAWLFEDWDNRF